MPDISLSDQLSIINDVYKNSIEPKQVVLNTPHISTRLFSHQSALVHSMYLHNLRMSHGFIINSQIIHGKLGILGDPHGTGKTLSVLAYISMLQSAPVVHAPNSIRQGDLNEDSNRYFYSNHIQTHSDASSTHLIVVPVHLYSQWKQEIQRHTTLNCFPIDNRRILRNRTTPGLIVASDIVLITNKMYRYVYEHAHHNRIRWKHIFIDEATSIHFTANDPHLEFEFMWLISSDWLGFMFKNVWISASNLLYIQGRHVLHNDCVTWLQCMNTHNTNILTAISSSTFLKHYIPYNHIGRSSLILLSNALSLQNSFTIPKPIHITLECRQNYTLTSLRQMPRLLTSPRQIPAIFDALGVCHYNLQSFIGEYEERRDLIQRKIEDDCSICLDTPCNRVLVRCCMNAFCGGCILRHIAHNSACPTCRAHIGIDDFAFFPVDQDISDSSIIHNRHNTCIQYIQQHMNEPAIIFTSFENTYYQLLPELQRLGIECDRLEVNTLGRTLADFESGRVNVLFTSNIDIIRGLNLTRLQHLIFFYEAVFYDQREILISSAQRLNRLNPLKVVQLHSMAGEEE